MNKLPSEAERWAQDFLAELQNTPHEQADIAICAPFTHLPGLGALLVASPIKLGAQDVSAHAVGAYTGEVSAAMLKDVGVSYVIIGHSERRDYHQESDALVGEKLRAVQAQGLVPILCVGESEAERERGESVNVVMAQLRKALGGLELPNANALVIAYEPIWAIGTGKSASAQDAQEMCTDIRRELRELFGTVGDSIRILYGGSMKPANAAELLNQPDINGGLIGGASLELDSMLKLIEAAHA